MNVAACRIMYIVHCTVRDDTTQRMDEWAEIGSMFVFAFCV